MSDHNHAPWVYDLTVEDDESFVAEGFVVHNCPGCAAEEGTFHDMSEELDSHPGCRCTPIPWTKSWSSLGFPGVSDTRPSIGSPEERFAARSEAQQLAVMGKARLEALRSGDLSLSDLTRHTHSERWGAGMRPATLHELNLPA